MKFKRGDIVVTPSGDKFVTDGAGRFSGIGFGRPNRYALFTSDEVDPYTGPIYEKDGQRFVLSGEFREPKMDEWFYSFDSKPRCPTRATGKVKLTYRPILLLVPDIEPEFKVGDWVKTKSGYVFQIKSTF